MALIPRRKSTTYTPTGNLPAPAMVEQGSAATIVLPDVVPELTTLATRIRAYQKMLNNDAAVDVSLRAYKVPVQAATFYIQPFDDTQVNLDIAEFCGFNIFENLSKPFSLVMNDILKMYEFEFSVIEKVWSPGVWTPKRSGANAKNYTMLKKLAARPTPTIGQILYDDNGGPNGVKQNAIRAGGLNDPIDIPIDKLIIFSLNSDIGVAGKSILRTAYKHWYYKDNLYKIDGIQKERHGMGFQRVSLIAGFSDEDKKAGLELVQSIRTNERAGIVTTPMMDFSFVDMVGQPVDVLASIEHHNGQIMLNTMTQFLLLGMSSGGGRATAAAGQDMFTKSLKFVANCICDAINMYLIPQLVGYNFDTTNYPKLCVRNIGEAADLQKLASAFSNLLAQNAITMDFETEQFFRELFDLPYKLGDKQTPENNAGAKAPVDPNAPVVDKNAQSGKGDVNVGNQDGGNTPLGTDASGG